MSVIDFEQFHENFQYYDHETVVEVIGNFFQEADERMDVIGKCIKDGDFAGLSFHAHSLKSVVGNFMAPPVYEICRKLEESAKQNAADQIPLLFSTLTVLLPQLIAELKSYLEEQD